MPSWNDGESSDEWLGDLTALDYAPNTTEDPSFTGIATGSELVSDGHGKKPRRCVAFQGVDTGRRFYMCSIENEVINCGFVRWVDAEWPVQLQNALGKIWDMYNSTLSEGLEDAANKAGQIKELAAEKTKFEQKYYTLILDVNKMIDDAEKRVIEKNFAKLNECSEVEEVKKEKNLVMQDLQDVKREKQVLMQEVQLVKRENHVLMQEVQQVKLEKTEVLQELEEVKKEKTEVLQELALLKDSQKQLKEEKKKLEYMIYDHLKASDANKGKLQRIKQIMEE